MSNFGVWDTKGAPVQAIILLLNSSEAPHYLWQTVSMAMALATFQYAAKAMYTYPLKFLDICSIPPPKTTARRRIDHPFGHYHCLSKLEVFVPGTIDIWTR